MPSAPPSVVDTSAVRASLDRGVFGLPSETELSCLMVEALGENNLPLFYTAQQQLTHVSSLGMGAVPSSYKHPLARAAAIVGQALGVLPNPSSSLDPKFPIAFVQTVDWAAQSRNLAFYDTLINRAHEFGVTPQTHPRSAFDASSDATRWDAFYHLAARNELQRLKHIEHLFGWFAQNLLHTSSPSSDKNAMLSAVSVIPIVSASIAQNAWETFDWLTDIMRTAPIPTHLSFLSFEALNAPSVYWDALVEKFPNNYPQLLGGFNAEDKAGTSVQYLDRLLDLVERCTPDDLRYLSSKDFSRATVRLKAIAERAESLLTRHNITQAMDTVASPTHNAPHGAKSRTKL